MWNYKKRVGRLVSYKKWISNNAYKIDVAINILIK